MRNNNRQKRNRMNKIMLCMRRIKLHSRRSSTYDILETLKYEKQLRIMGSREGNVNRGRKSTLRKVY